MIASTFERPLEYVLHGRWLRPTEEQDAFLETGTTVLCVRLKVR
jgi:hypothetical protein